MGKIKHALILGDEIAQLLAGEPDAIQSMAVEYALAGTMSHQERILLGNRITSHAVMSELETQFDEDHDVEEVGDNE